MSQSRSADALLREYERLLLKRAIPMGLIARGDQDRVAERHIQDSLRCLPCLEGLGRSVVDLGSGAGLPGIPVAISRPALKVTLVEGRERRAAFLEWAAESLGLDNVEVVAASAETCVLRADVCLARAFAGPGSTWDVASRLIRTGGKVLYFAGAGWTGAQEQALVARGIAVRICVPARFSWQGPLVMMSGSAAAS